MLRILLALLALAVVLPAQAALGPDPGREWSSADSTHFRINYAAPQRRQAEQIADIAERVYARLSRELQWEPHGKIEIVVVDEFDLANGYSTPLPFNESSIYLTTPNAGELLDNGVWLEMLLTHELTHTFHLDKVHGVPDGLRNIFGRNPLLFPNEWQPTWNIEGIATYKESTPEAGRGRLRGPTFEALMRIEHERGFKSLSEINSDGRALPTSKQYLYGVYFYDFLARKYGPDAIYQYINNFSDNIVPRVHSNPVVVTGKHMDELWEEFITDLTQQMTQREAPLKTAPRADGEIILPANFFVDSLAPVADGVLAVVDDGLLRNQLAHIDAQGKVVPLVYVNSGAVVDVGPDGKVLIAQPDICNNHSFYYDLYTWSSAEGLQRKTQCSRYRRAVWAGGQIAALHMEGGISRLIMLEQHEKSWRELRTLYQTPDRVEAVDLAASPDGKHVALVIKQAGAWQVLEFDTTAGTPRVLFNYDAPLHGLRYSANGEGLEFIAVRDNVNNLWRYNPATSEFARLSHTYTAVTLHSGVAKDGSVVLGVLAADGTELRRMQTAAPIAKVKLASGKPGALQGETPTLTNKLGESSDYHALYSIYPRAWLPSVLADRGLTAYGAYTWGSDVMGWHNYMANVMWETSQHEAIGSLSYTYLDEHFLSVSRNLLAKQWTGSRNNETITIFDRETSVQWASMYPWLKAERRIHLGIGAAMQTTERVRIAGLTTRPQNERVSATFLRYDTRNTNWYSDGINRGNLSTLLYESYRPFNSYYDGYITRFDTHGYLPLGDTVLSARWTEAHAHGTTEAFQLGGAADISLTQPPMLNQRTLPLRGYQSGEAVLTGLNARILNAEWRVPLADVDRHAMVPPIGINRLSAAIFMDAGSVWNNAGAKSKYYRGAGAELAGELKVYYRVALPVRLGVAMGLDGPGGHKVYFMMGKMF